MNKLSPEQVNKLSKFELNCYIAIILFPDLQYADSGLVTKLKDGAANFRLCNAIGEDLDAGTYDYCNNWNDLMPLVVEWGISRKDMAERVDHICYREVSLGGCVTGRTFEVRNADPQRALAECLLLVLQDKE